MRAARCRSPGQDHGRRRCLSIHRLLRFSLRTSSQPGGIGDCGRRRGVRITQHAFPHLAVLDLRVGRVAGVLRAPQNALVDCLADGRFVLLLWMVESVLPAAGGLFDDVGLPPGHIDGPLPDARAEAGWAAGRGSKDPISDIDHVGPGVGGPGIGRPSDASAHGDRVCRAGGVHGRRGGVRQPANLALDQPRQ